MFLKRIDRTRLAIPAHRARAREALPVVAFEPVHVEGCGGEDQAVAFVITKVNHDQPGLAEQCTFVEQACAASVRELVTARVGGILARYTVGKRVDKDVAAGGRATQNLLPPLVGGEGVNASAPRIGHLCDRRQRTDVRAEIAHHGVVARAPRLHCADSGPEIVAAARVAAQRIARLDQRGKFAGETLLVGAGAKHRRGEARMCTKAQHAPPEFADTVVAVDRTEPAQQVACLRDRAVRRRIEPAQRIRAPSAEFKRELGQFHLSNFWSAFGFQAPALWPQAITRTGAKAPGTTGALIGRSLRDAHDVESRETRIRIETRLARLPQIDDRAHAGQG